MQNDSLDAILSDDAVVSDDILSVPSDYDSDSTFSQPLVLDESLESLDGIFEHIDLETVETPLVPIDIDTNHSSVINRRTVKQSRGRKMKSSVDDRNDLDVVLLSIFSEEELRLGKQPWANLKKTRGPFTTEQQKRLKTLRRRVLSRGYAHVNRLKTQKKNKEIESSKNFLVEENLMLKAENESLKIELAILRAHMLSSSP